MTAILGTAIFWLTGSPLGTSVPLLVVNFLYYIIIMHIAAPKRVEFPVKSALRRSLPRPILAALLLAAPMLLIRWRVDSLSLQSLVLIFLVLLVAYMPLLYGIVALKDERKRINELTGTVVRKLRRIGAR